MGNPKKENYKMKDQTRYEILDSLPAYGPMYIPITDNDEPYFSEGFVVRFYKSDGTDWVANFRPGWTGFNEVFGFPQHDLLVVIAGGLGYIMNPNNEKPQMTFGMTIDEVFQTETGSLVCSDGISIQLLDNQTGEHWQSERISWDGFKDLKLEGEIISGFSYDPTNSINPWTEFSLNLQTKELSGGSYRLITQIPKVHLQGENETKPWWKS